MIGQREHIINFIQKLDISEHQKKYLVQEILVLYKLKKK